MNKRQFLHSDSNLRLNNFFSRGNTSSSSLYLFTGVFVICVSVLLVFDLYQKRAEEALQVEVAKQNEAVEALVQPWSLQGRDSKEEEVKSFIAEIDTQINAPAIGTAEKKRLLVSKAMALGTVRSRDINYDNFTEAANILNSLYQVEDTNTESDADKYVTIPFYINLFDASCFYPRLGESLPTPYSDNYKRYVEQENLPENQALLLAIEDFANGSVDPRFVSDTATVMNRAYILALYFYAYGSQISPANLDITSRELLLWNNLSLLVENETTPILLTGINRGVIDPAIRYAFSYDIAKTYTVSEIPDEVNAAIDANYEKVFSLTRENSGINDQTSLAMQNILGSMMYLESMHRRYAGDELDTQKVREVLDIFIKNVSISTETREMASGYFMGGTTNDGQWMPIRAGFMKLVPLYPDLQMFFADSLGIDL